MLKRITILLTCFLFVFVSVPLYSYAEDNVPDGYNPVASKAEFLGAFNSYVKSRGADIQGDPSVTDDWTYDKVKYTCSQLNIDIEELKRELYYSQDNGGSIKDYFYTALAIDKLNAVFSQLMTDYGLSVGDLDVRKRMYDGYIFTDDEGNKCLVFVITMSNTYDGLGFNNTPDDPTHYIIQQGSALKYSPSYLDSLTGQTQLSITSNNRVYSTYAYKTSYAGVSNLLSWSSNQDGYYVYYCPPGSESTKVKDFIADGYLSVYVVEGTNNFYICRYNQNSRFNKVDNKVYYNLQIIRLSNYSVTNTQASDISLVSSEIKQPLVVQNTYITVEGDTIINNPPGGKDPGWDVSGGQGTYDDGNGNTYNITFPDFELPDLNIDWSISGLGNKFPFSIPFDIASLVAVLNAEPEAPRFQGTMDLGITTYEYDINLAQFDTVASVCRIAELLLLVFGLILITRSIIKG